MTMIHVCILSVIFFSEFLLIRCDTNIVLIDTNVGQIRGFKSDAFISYLGIPYGVVDFERPFGPAIPHPTFTNPYNAFHAPEICPQIDNGVPKGNLNCLSLNIYAPGKKTKALPVMVFIHGGAFVAGSANLENLTPKFLVQEDVIVVTVNYRLGPYGFLCWKDSSYRNQGLKDQSLALKWINNNIDSFGGDNENVVIFGQSAGSISVNYHLMYNNDLFHKAILQSGVLISPVSFGDQHFKATIAKGIGFRDYTNEQNYIEFLNKFPSSYLINSTFDYMNYRPCVGMENTCLKRCKQIKILIGNTNKEMALFYGDASADFFKDNDIIKNALSRGFHDVTDEMVKDVQEFYMKNNKRDDFIDFTTDFEQNYPVERMVRLFATKGCTVYRYLFNYDGGRNFLKIRNGLNYSGAVHGDELGYEFASDVGNKSTSIEDDYVTNKMVGIWTDFAKHGYPVDRDLGVPYPATNTLTKPYILIDFPIEVRYAPFKKRMQFWDRFYEKFGSYSKGNEWFNHELMMASASLSVIERYILIASCIVSYFLR